MEWISIEINTPNEGQVCLVYDEMSEIIRLREWGRHYFHSLDSDSDDGIQSINISHWMELPKKPKDKNETNN